MVDDYADMVSAYSMTTRTRYRHSQRLHGHGQGYADTLKASHRFLRNSQAKKLFRFVYTPKSDNLKILKPPYVNTKLGGHAIFDLCDGISLQKEKTFRETVFACSYGV